MIAQYVKWVLFLVKRQWRTYLRTTSFLGITVDVDDVVEGEEFGEATLDGIPGLEVLLFLFLFLSMSDVMFRVNDDGLFCSCC